MSSDKENTEDWKDHDPDNKTLEKWKNDPNNWILGMFYYNKEDKRICLPKKIEGMGITINFANPKSVLALLAALAFFGMVLFSILRRS